MTRDFFEFGGPFRDVYEYDDPSWTLNRRLERDREREPGAFRGRPVAFSAPERTTPVVSSRVVQTSKQAGRYEPANPSSGHRSVSDRVVQTSKRVVNNSEIVDGNIPARSRVEASGRCAIVGVAG